MVSVAVGVAVYVDVGVIVCVMVLVCVTVAVGMYHSKLIVLGFSVFNTMSAL
jgi:hypothetical protein